MNRILSYHITEQDSSQSIEAYLKGKGYSSQCIKELKKMPESILLNGQWEYMRTLVKDGDTLVVHVQEEASSEKIPPIEMPLDIVYEDEDIMVLNKPADMPIHPSLNNYYNSLANGLACTLKSRASPLFSSV